MVENTFIENLKAFKKETISIKCWLVNKRGSNKLLFLVVRDGTGFCQCVLEHQVLGTKVFQQIDKLPYESVLKIQGLVVEDQKQVGGYEILVEKIQVINLAHPDYPLSKKKHGSEFLMNHRHLWLRTKKSWAIMRIRNTIIHAIHTFLQSQHFLQLDPPILTKNACEGTTDLFKVDLFDKDAYLSQSGQLFAEALAICFSKVYSFGPVFRAEKSKTRRHLLEFWMLEPEMVFCNNDQNMDLIEKLIHAIIKETLQKCSLELDILNRDIKPLENSLACFPRISYDQAVKILKGAEKVKGRTPQDLCNIKIEKIKSNLSDQEQILEKKQLQLAQMLQDSKKKNALTNQVDQLKIEIKAQKETLKNIPQWLNSAKNFVYGSDFGGSDETLISSLFNTPVMIYNWPVSIKAFYMKRTDDKQYAKGVDVIAPEGYGEIVGGGERETDLSLLTKEIEKHGLSQDDFSWYLDLRKYGNVPHSGFGLGLERFVAWICNLSHLRESIPFPRLYGHLKP